MTRTDGLRTHAALVPSLSSLRTAELLGATIARHQPALPIRDLAFLRPLRETVAIDPTDPKNSMIATDHALSADGLLALAAAALPALPGLSLHIEYEPFPWNEGPNGKAKTTAWAGVSAALARCPGRLESRVRLVAKVRDDVDAEQITEDLHRTVSSSSAPLQ